MRVSGGFVVSEKFQGMSMSPGAYLISGTPDGDISNINVDLMSVEVTENLKVQLKFPIRDGITHSNIYMFRPSKTRGPLFFHETMRETLAAANENECVCGRLRISSGMGTISMSKTVYKYIFPESTLDITPVSPVGIATQDSNSVVEKFDRCVDALRKVESDPLIFAEDVTILGSILRVPDHILKQYSRDMVETIRMSGGDIQRVFDVHSRTTRLSTLLSMMDL